MVFDREAIDGVLVGALRGNVTLDDLLDGTRATWSQIEGPDARVLFDLVNARFDLRADEIARLAEFARQGSPENGIRMAFLLGTDLEFGLVRMFMALRESEGVEINVVRDRERALDWLSG